MILFHVRQRGQCRRRDDSVGRLEGRRDSEDILRLRRSAQVKFIYSIINYVSNLDFHIQTGVLLDLLETGVTSVLLLIIIV